MTRRYAVTAAVLAILAGTPAYAAPPVASGPVAVTFAQPSVNVRIGERFTLRSQVTNAAAGPTDTLLAHLNVASLTSDVYVDPEDWADSRSRTVQPVAPGASTPIDWQLQAVNVGSFDVYIVLLPDGPGTAGTGPLTVSPPVHVTVAARETLNAGGALPVAVVVPVLVALFALAIRLRARRRRRPDGASH